MTVGQEEDARPNGVRCENPSTDGNIPLQPVGDIISSRTNIMDTSFDLEAGSRNYDGHAFTHKQVTVSWRNVTIVTKKARTILKNISGNVRPGELTAIMGPSGSGKTTLLNVLSGFRKEIHDGMVFVNGVQRDVSAFRNLSCYVPEDTHLLEYLTVNESITLAAALKIPTYVTRKEKKIMVQNVIDSLGLSAVQNSRACKLSGGERKRLCIGQEIVNNPSLVFLDEPTSGLDSSSCLQCVELLKSLAREGKTVVCTFHQPSARIFEIFDQLYLVAEGQCVYRGPPKHLAAFLSQQGLSCPQYHNPADFAMEVILGEHGAWNGKLKEATDKLMVEEDKDVSTEAVAIPVNITATKGKYSSSSLKPTGLSAKKSRGYPTSFFNQIKVLMKRNAVYTIRNPILTHAQLLTYAAVAIFISLLYYGVGNDAGKMIDNAGFVFFTVVFLLFTSMNCTVLTFPLETPVVTREHLNNWYSSKAYFFAKTITDLPSTVLFPIMYCGISYWLTAQPAESVRFVMFAAIMVLVTLVAQAQSVIVGAIFNTQTAVFLSASSAVPLCILSGFLARFEGMFSFLKWTSYATYVRYIFQGALYSLYGMNRNYLDCNKLMCLTPRYLLKHFDIDESEFYLFYGAPLAFLLAFKIIGYFTVRRRMKTALIR